MYRSAVRFFEISQPHHRNCITLFAFFELALWIDVCRGVKSGVLDFGLDAAVG